MITGMSSIVRVGLVSYIAMNNPFRENSSPKFVFSESSSSSLVLSSFSIEISSERQEELQNAFSPLDSLYLAGGASLSLTYIGSERIIPGYGGGMSSAKSTLESDTRVLAFEAGRKHKVRVNTISTGPLRSRAAKAIGFIDMMIDYSIENAPLQKELSAGE
nr:enoyl-[acyl-carrier-protein] reductase [NADH], chloroplastic-like [Ipomoea batatas]